jgi:uridine phosphorylase
MTDETLYLRCKPGDVAPLVLLSGDPARVERIAVMLENPYEISRNREFGVVTGSYRGTPVSAVSGGIGAPSTAIAMQELAMLGVRAIVRIGTMMGVHAPLQSVVLSLGAARFEGTSAYYLPQPYPAIPDWALVHVLDRAGRQHALDVRLGLTATYDAFYPEMAPSLAGRGKLDLSVSRRAGVLSMDMETSLIFVMGTLLQLATAAMCLVTVQAEPLVHLDAQVRSELDDRMVHAALDGLIAFEGS